MLEVYLNGQRLSRGTDYQEIVSGSDYYQFNLTLTYPTIATDILSISFGAPHTDPVIAGSLSGTESVYISGVYPVVNTGFNITYTGFAPGAKNINLNVLYR
jgi:hypothetical protein